MVCGAPNARAGMVGVFGPPGAYVPGSRLELKVAAIRGVESHGMMCSVRELELGDAHEGIIELPATMRPQRSARSYADCAGLDDPVIDVAVTPNRQDCMGVRGIARDLAAAGLGGLKPLAEVYRTDAIEPIAGDGARSRCAHRRSARLPGLLRAGGGGRAQRRRLRNGCAVPERDRPEGHLGAGRYHQFRDDRSRPTAPCLRPARSFRRPLVARRAEAGETLLALNGKTYALDATMTVIADDADVHDIGGIMGGEDSGVTETTTDVIIECAYFDPDHVARTGQKLALTSDARQRFERGVDPAFLDEGLAVATGLVLDHCGGPGKRYHPSRPASGRDADDHL